MYNQTDLIINNALDVHLQPIAIRIQKGIITQVSSEPIIDETCKEIIDANQLIMMPGLIDPHVHFRTPGYTYKEDFLTASKACAKGGITSFMDMPNTNPSTTTVEALAEKKILAQQQSLVHYGFHFGGSSTNNSLEIRKVVGANEAMAVKIYLNVTTGEMLIEDRTVLETIIQEVDILMVHAENDMIDTAMEICLKYNKPLYIAHVSSAYEMQKIIDYKKMGYPIYAEVTPHHLFLNETIRESTSQNQLLLRMKPELKTEADNMFLWKALQEGYIDTIGTDHAPHTKDEKLTNITFGMPGVETSLALMLTAYHQNKISLPDIQFRMSENAATIFKLPNKGTISVGADGDICLVDLTHEWIVTSAEIESKCGWSPYENWSLKGKNIRTIILGETVYNKGTFNENIRGTELKKQV